MQGRSDEMIALRQEAIRLDPLNAEFHRIIGIAFARHGRLEEAEAALRRALQLQPEARNLHWGLSMVATLRGDLETALREAELEQEPLRDVALAIVRFARGEREEADAALRALIEQARPAVTIAGVYAFRGEADLMFDWLNRSYEQREPTLVSALIGQPYLVRYYSDPRYVELCRKTGVTLPK